MPVVIAVVIVVIAVVIAVPIPVPTMIVFEPAAIPAPVAVEVPFAIMTWGHPYRAGIRRPAPIAGMPFVMATDWIPVAIHPGIVRAGSWRPNRNHSWRWRRANSDSDGEVCRESRSYRDNSQN